ncbi:MAG: CRTAC1 family protein [Acidimicrobiia bacterium]
MRQPAADTGANHRPEARLKAAAPGRPHWVVVFLALAACFSPTGAATEIKPFPVGSEVEVHISSYEEGACTGSFTSHQLDHETRTTGRPALFESNGSGIAIGDLDDDSDLDIVLAAMSGDSTVLWNHGGLKFTPQRLPHSGRAVAIVDVDADGLADIVLSRGNLPPLLLRQEVLESGPEFVIEAMRGVDAAAYAMDWSDLDHDGDLDLVTASYDAELSIAGGRSSGAHRSGVVVYENVDGAFLGNKVVDSSHALALLVRDLDGDGSSEIWIGNDFLFPDVILTYTDSGWMPRTLPRSTTMSTMGFSTADIDNDGVTEIFATDMRPTSDDPETSAAWQPVVDSMYGGAPGQDMANALYRKDGNDGWQNEAVDLGLAATGWSWSAKFGDLDHDGLIDLYVVTGMMAVDVFPHLPGGELLEENVALANRGGGYVPRPEWNLNSMSSGRGMSMGDLDLDGDLDIVVNNLNSPSELFENQICGGESLEVELVSDRPVVGSVIALHTSAGTLTRELTSASGYLSGDPTTAHFGFPNSAEVLELTVSWPLGHTTTITELAPNTHLRIEATFVPAYEGPSR